MAAEMADGIADVVAGDGARPGEGQERVNADRVGRRIDCAENQRGLARRRQAEILEQNGEGHGPRAVLLDVRLYVAEQKSGSVSCAAGRRRTGLMSSPMEGGSRSVLHRSA